MLDPFGLTPGRLPGERGARSLAAGPGSGDGNPPGFLGVKSWQKPDTESIISEHTTEWKGFTRPVPKVFGLVSQNPKRDPDTG